MPVLEYRGDLWGYGMGDKVFCLSCYHQRRGENTQGIYALGTEDLDENDEERLKKFAYICDGCGKSSI